MTLTNKKKAKRYGWTDGWTNRQWVIELRARDKKGSQFKNVRDGQIQ